MRDAHRMKEKIDLSLDNRQIVSLLIAGLVVLGAVFVLGVVVGKKLAESDKTAGAPDLLSALDEKAAAMDKVRSDPAVTFPDELTKKEQAERREPPPAPARSPVAAARPPAEASAPPAPAAKPMDKPADSSAAVATAQEPQAQDKPGPSPEKPAPAAAAPEAMPAAHGKEALVEKIKAAAVAPHATPEGKVPELPVATRTAEKTAPHPAASQPKQAPAVSSKGAYTLQLSAAQTREEADRFASGLKGKGYTPYIVSAQVPGKGTWYRVRLGSFPSRDAATRYLQDFRRETQMEAFVANKE